MGVVRVFSLFLRVLFFFFFKQKTAYEMRISDWSSDVCSSDLARRVKILRAGAQVREKFLQRALETDLRHDRLHLAVDARDFGQAKIVDLPCGDRKSVV